LNIIKIHYLALDAHNSSPYQQELALPVLLYLTTFTVTMPHNVLYSDISDHMPTLVLINNIKRPRVYHDVYKRKTKNFVVEDFLTEIAVICNNFVRIFDQTPTPPVNMLFDNFFIPA